MIFGAYNVKVMSANDPYLSVVIPSYNELANVQRGVLESVAEFLATQPYSYEVILTDDGSTDGTTEILAAFAKKNPHFRLLANPHAGKGPTVKSGMLLATGSWRLFTDFDQSTPLSEVTKFLTHTSQFDIITGSREEVGAQRQKESLLRHVMGRVFNTLVRILAVPGMRDTQCGFKLFSAAATEMLFPKLYIYGGNLVLKDAFTGAFDVELLFLARKNNLKIKEVGVAWSHYASDRVNPLKDSYRMLRDIIKIRLADLGGKYSQNN